MDAYADDISTNDLVSPTAQDILKQIEDIDAENNGTLSLVFMAGQTNLTEEQKNEISAVIISRFRTGRLQITSYATQNADMSARRVSLERALNIRTFLGEHEITNRDIDIFPIGDKTPNPRDIAQITIMSE